MEKPHFFEKNNRKEDREKQSEKLIKFLKQAEHIEAFKGKKFEDIFSDEKNKRKYINELKENDFLDLLDGLNGLLKNKDRKDWQSDGQEVTVGSNRMVIDTPPVFEDRQGLLEKTLQVAKKMNSKEQNLEDIALLFLTSIRAIHAYADANGRTARFIYKLLTTDVKDLDTLKHTISDEGRNSVDVDFSYVATKKIENKLLNDINNDSIENLYTRENPDFLTFNKDINEKDKKYFLELLEKDKKCLFAAILKLFKDDPKLNLKIYLKKLGDTKYISTDYLVEKIDNKQIEKIFSEYRKFKKKVIEFLIQAISEPENEELKLDISGEKKSVKDILKK